MTTYGEVTGEIREYLTRLLANTEVEASLGGGEERKENLAALVRYRSDLVRWCRFAVGAVSPAATSYEWSRRASPIADFLHHLDRLIGYLPRHLPPLTELLQVQHDSNLLRDWQDAARSAASSELVIPQAIARARGEQERQVIIKDAVDIFCGLIRLDDRYAVERGWRPLAYKHPALGRAIEMSRDLAATPRDRRIDLVSDARNEPIPAPLLPGTAGAVQAQHNVEHYLQRPTSAFALRDVMKTQAVVSLRAAVLAQELSPELASHFGDRARLYVELVKSAVNVGGNLGGGKPAVTQSSLAADRLAEAIKVRDLTGLTDLAHQSYRVDARVAVNIETGFRKDRYLIAEPDLVVAKLPNDQGIYQATEVWRPIARGETPELLTLARERVQPRRREGIPALTEAIRQSSARAFVSKPALAPPR